MAMIEFREVGKTFRSQTGAPVEAVTEVSLAVEESRVVCIVGSSGCGKTTLLNLAAGFERPTVGSVWVGGRPVERPGRDRAVIFQNIQGSLFPWMTVARNVEFGLKMRGVPRPARRDQVERHLMLVGLAGQADRFPFELSGGMKQRVQIARALANDPEILLMDEPFGALDAQTRTRLQRELLRIWETTRRTILFVTHDIGEAVTLGDQVVVMTSGPRSTIAKVFEVPLTRPRHGAQPGFGELCEEIERLIL